MMFSKFTDRFFMPDNFWNLFFHNSNVNSFYSHYKFFLASKKKMKFIFKNTFKFNLLSVKYQLLSFFQKRPIKTHFTSIFNEPLKCPWNPFSAQEKFNISSFVLSIWILKPQFRNNIFQMSHSHNISEFHFLHQAQLQQLWIFVLWFKYLLEIVWFPNIPILESNWSSICHPEERSFLSLISSRCPEMLMAQSKVFDVLF